VNLMSHLVQRQLALDPPLTRDLAIERDLPVPMPDGTILPADRWARRTGGDKLPVAVQVSSGSFPRYARNPGTGEPRATAVRLLAADQSVYHDPERPSAITLPVRA
jgi:predicted acyl esterase